jgi:DNA polymerase-3 subunit epsilon
MRADLVIAHNANFDRKILERQFPELCHRPWACSVADIDWLFEGYDSAKLFNLATAFGFFYPAHSALDDCHAGVAILTQTLPRTGGPVMEKLLQNARRVEYRFWALDAPFDARIKLKERGV